MTLADWWQQTRARITRDGWAGVEESAYRFYVGAWRRSGQLVNYGEPVYEREWDVLVVLDACRADVMDEVGEEYSLDPTDSIYSVASSSPEWMEKNFNQDAYGDEMARTAYVTGNAFSDALLESSDFLLLDETWRYSWDEELGTIHPRPLTDRAVAVHRELDPDRLIVHYMQPHRPYVPEPFESDGIDPESMGQYTATEHAFDRLRRGEITRSEHWRRYRDNLKYVLDDVTDVLLCNVDADRAVITSDHGELFGELGLYDHPRNLLLPTAKRVPWVRTSATDTGEYEPEVEPTDVDTDVESRLEDLGYL